MLCSNMVVSHPTNSMFQIFRKRRHRSCRRRSRYTVSFQIHSHAWSASIARTPAFHSGFLAHQVCTQRRLCEQALFGSHWKWSCRAEVNIVGVNLPPRSKLMTTVMSHLPSWQSSKCLRPVSLNMSQTCLLWVDMKAALAFKNSRSTVS